MKSENVQNRGLGEYSRLFFATEGRTQPTLDRNNRWQLCSFFEKNERRLRRTLFSTESA